MCENIGENLPTQVFCLTHRREDGQSFQEVFIGVGRIGSGEEIPKISFAKD